MTTTAGNGNGGNGRDWLSLKAWAQAIGVIGIPGAIAIFLVYMGATQIPALVRQVDRLIVEVNINRDLIREHAARDVELLRILQRVCANTAKDEATRTRCFDR